MNCVCCLNKEIHELDWGKLLLLPTVVCVVSLQTYYGKHVYGWLYLAIISNFFAVLLSFHLISFIITCVTKTWAGILFYLFPFFIFHFFHKCYHTFLQQIRDARFSLNRSHCLGTLQLTRSVLITGIRGYTRQKDSYLSTSLREMVHLQSHT